MATFFQSVRQGFGRGSSKNNSQQKLGNGSQSPSPTSFHAPPMQNMIPSSSFSSTLSAESSTPDVETKKFFNEKYANCSVKGNFLTLAAQPKNVELGEWLAHQVVEMSRLLTGMLQVVQEVDTNQGVPLCNEQSCPTMSAGRLTYTWLENGRPARIPAPSYIIRVQKWIVGKIHDPNVFPTDPPTGGASATYASGDVGGIPSNTTPIPMGPTSLNTSLATLSGGDWIGKASGFPQNFHQDCKSIVKQMFRCYAHLYHCHYDNPFWHINRHLELNSCFVHFVTVATYYDLLPKKDMEPLQPLIDIFIKEKVIPPEAVRQHHS